jgi:hypothetical protein
MPTKLSTGKVRRVYEFIKENRDHYRSARIATLCLCEAT